MAGFYFGSFSYSWLGVNGIINFGFIIGVSFGLDFEYVISVWNSKWLVFVVFYLYNVKEEYIDGFFEVEFDFKVVKVFLGFCYNVFKEGWLVWFVDVVLVFFMDGVFIFSFFGGGDC